MAPEHYRVSDISVNKLGYVVCVTDEMLAGQPSFEDLVNAWKRRMAMKRRKARLMNRRCRYCGNQRKECRCE